MLRFYNNFLEFIFLLYVSIFDHYVLIVPNILYGKNLQNIQDLDNSLVIIKSAACHLLQLLTSPL